MSDDARFDPRFDPAFQPGYDGPLAAKAPRSALIGHPPEAGPASRVPDEQLEVRGSHVARPEPHIEEDEPAARRPNPFLIALAAVALALIGGCLYLVSRMRELFADSQSVTDFDYVTMQVLMIAAPVGLGLGIATGVGVLFLFAVRWDRRG
jgi:hypothetical protein